MKKTISLADWLEGCGKGSPAKREKYKGVTVQTAAEMINRTRVTVWTYVLNGKLDAWRIIDPGGREVAVIVTLGSIRNLVDVADEYSAQVLLDL